MNLIQSIIFIALGIVSVPLLDNDATFCVFALTIGISSIIYIMKGKRNENGYLRRVHKHR